MRLSKFIKHFDSKCVKIDAICANFILMLFVKTMICYMRPYTCIQPTDYIHNFIRCHIALFTAHHLRYTNLNFVMNTFLLAEKLETVIFTNLYEYSFARTIHQGIYTRNDRFLTSSADRDTRHRYGMVSDHMHLGLPVNVKFTACL